MRALDVRVRLALDPTLILANMFECSRCCLVLSSCSKALPKHTRPIAISIANMPHYATIVSHISKWAGFEFTSGAFRSLLGKEMLRGRGG